MEVFNNVAAKLTVFCNVGQCFGYYLAFASTQTFFVVLRTSALALKPQQLPRKKPIPS